MVSSEAVMKKVLLSSFVVALFFIGESSTSVISTGTAQSLTINRDGIQIDRRSRRVDRREAVRIAQRNGVSRVRAADLRGRYWVVTGETRRGRDILRLTIDARNGRIAGRRYIHR